MKTLVMTDSNSGITQDEAKKLNIEVVPMPFTIDGVEYLEDINLTQEEFYKKLDDDANVSTSQPSLGKLSDLWEKKLKEYDEILYIPMSSGLSQSCSSAMMLSDDFNGKVQVVNNQRISVTQKQSVFDSIELVKRGLDAKRVKEILEETKFKSIIYITIDTLKYLKKGGRLTPAVALIGTLLKIKPVLVIKGEKLDAYKKTRKMKDAKEIMIDAIKEYISTNNVKKYSIHIAHTNNYEEAEEFKKEVMDIFNCNCVISDPLSLSVSCHIGAGSLALAITEDLDYDSYK